MGFILDSIANIFIEALDTLVLWVCNLSVVFKLDIGEGSSEFSKVFQSETTGEGIAGATVTISMSDFATAIGVLAVMCVLLATVFKIYQLFLNPHAKVESPGEIVLRFTLGLIGIVAAYPIFRYIQKGFNAAHGAFVAPYKRVTALFKQKNLLALKTAEEVMSSEYVSRKDGGEGFSEAYNAKDAFLFGSDHLIGEDDGIMQHPFALAIITIFIGIALMMALIKLLFEVYERYVILAVLYLFAPLAFATLVTKGGQVFKSYWWMVFSQFILLSSNLLFLTIFMAAWYNVIKDGANMTGEEGKAFFPTSQQFVTTMFLLISWLIVGQKFDELLRSLGLSAAQTGQGIMAAALGSVLVARAAMGGIGAGVSNTGKALTGQTGTQKAISAGMRSQGREGGLVGKGAFGLSQVAGSLGNSKDGIPEWTGADQTSALNNMVKGTEGRDGLKAPSLGKQGSDVRNNFDAAKLQWNETTKDSGIYTAYDPTTNSTFVEARTDAARSEMQKQYGEARGADGTYKPGELGRYTYKDQSGVKQERLVHIHEGKLKNNSVMPERQFDLKANTKVN